MFMPCLPRLLNEASGGPDEGQPAYQQSTERGLSS